MTHPAPAAPIPGADDPSLVARPARWPLLVVVAVAIALRLVTWSRATMIMNDGPDFLWQALRFLDGDSTAALSHPYHPLYGALIAAVARATGGSTDPSHLEACGLAVSLAGGVLLVIAAWGLARRAFPDLGAAPAAAGLLAAVNVRAVTFGADIQSEGLFTGLVLATLWTLVDARRPHRLLAAGLLTGLTYLTRPEGLFLVLPFGLWFLDALSRSGRRAQAIAGAATFTVGLGVCVVPYVVAMHDVSGAWGLSLKPSLQFAGLRESATLHAAPVDSPLGWPVVLRARTVPIWAETRPDDDGSPGNEPAATPGADAPSNASPPSRPDVAVARPAAGESASVPEPVGWTERVSEPSPGWIAAAAESLWDLLHALRVDLLVFVLPGLVMLARRRPRLALGLGLTVVGWLAVGTWQLRVNDYLSNRHMMVALAALLPVGGAGLVGFWQRGLPWRAAAVVALLVSVLTGTQEQRTQHVPRLEALAWIRDHTRPDQWFGGHRRRDGWYAQRPMITVRVPADVAELRRVLAERDAPYLLFDLDKLVQYHPDWLPSGQVEEVTRFGEGDETVLVLVPRFAAD